MVPTGTKTNSKQQTDEEKTTALVKAGWRIIRIREKPLRKVTLHDIVVPNNTSVDTAKIVVDKLLQQIEKVCGISLPDVNRYLRRKTLAYEKEANEFIQDLLETKPNP